MRKVQAVFMLTLLVALAGCPEGSRMNLIRPSGDSPTPTAPPAKEDLVAYLNNNAARIPGIKSDDITLTCYMGGPVGIPLGGKLCAQGPRKFRMTGEMMGRPEVDLGSNDQEFWYWIRQGDKYQFFCPYQSIEDGKVNMPFPFRPDWVLEAMGMGNYGSAEKYELVVDAEHLKLIEKTRSAQGVPVKKIIVLRRFKAKGDEAQVTNLLLEDEKTGKLICSAQIVRRQILPNGAELPRELKLEWPEQKLKLVLHLNRVDMTQNPPPNAFVRAPISGFPSLNMATGRVEALQQAGGPKGMPH